MRRGHSCKATLHLVKSNNPVVVINVFKFLNAADNIYKSETVAFVYVDVFYFLVLRHHVSAFSLLKEVDVCDVISFEMNVLVFLHHVCLEEGTDPCDE